MSDVYKNIKRIREEKRMSQEELAHLVGFKSRSSINKIEAGINDITQTKLAQIAQALGVSIETLLGNTPVKYTVPPSSQPLEESPISNLVKDMFKDEPQVADLFLTRSPEGQDTPFARKLAEISQNDKDFLKRAILMVLEKNGYDADTKAK